MKYVLLYLLLFFCSTNISAQNKIYDSSIIHFNIYGKGEPVFVLSGGPGNNCMQEEDVAIKIGEKYQAILLEQRGTGRSMPKTLDTNSVNMDAYIKDILHVMDSLKIKKPNSTDTLGELYMPQHSPLNIQKKLSYWL